MTETGTSYRRENDILCNSFVKPHIRSACDMRFYFLKGKSGKNYCGKLGPSPGPTDSTRGVAPKSKDFTKLRTSLALTEATPSRMFFIGSGAPNKDVESAKRRTWEEQSSRDIKHLLRICSFDDIRVSSSVVSAQNRITSL